MLKSGKFVAAEKGLELEASKFEVPKASKALGLEVTLRFALSEMQSDVLYFRPSMILGLLWEVGLGTYISALRNIDRKAAYRLGLLCFFLACSFILSALPVAYPQFFCGQGVFGPWIDFLCRARSG